MDVFDVFHNRMSVRFYKDNPISDEVLSKVLDAARLAPSAGNVQPWHFIVVTDRRTLNDLGKAHPYGKMLFEAPLCIAVCGDRNISPNFWIQDCSAAAENLLLAATALDLGAVWLGVYPRENRVKAVRKILKIPDPIIPLNLISIGHPGEKKEPRTQYDQLRVHQQHW